VRSSLHLVAATGFCNWLQGQLQLACAIEPVVATVVATIAPRVGCVVMMVTAGGVCLARLCLLFVCLFVCLFVSEKRSQLSS